MVLQENTGVRVHAGLLNGSSFSWQVGCYDSPQAPEKAFTFRTENSYRISADCRLKSFSAKTRALVRVPLGRGLSYVLSENTRAYLVNLLSVDG